MEFLTDIQEEVWVPSEVALCPVCYGPLVALPDEFEQICPSVNLYVATTAAEVTCVKDKYHGLPCDEAWEHAYAEVSRWLKRGPFLFERPSERCVRDE
jgi:hypothetical protein